MDNFSTSSKLFSRSFSINTGGRILEMDIPLIMGILNATPDSFYEGSRVPETERGLELAGRMLADGAAILDLGAASSRPGAAEIPAQEEIRRLTPLMEALRTQFPDALLSLDSWQSEVVRELHRRFRIDLVNDISAGVLDPAMHTTIAELGLPYIMMHMKGKPATMQEEPQYNNISDEVLQFFAKLSFRLRKLGINDLIVDPGFGFGKTREQNYRLLRELHAFAALELPLLVGISRKF